MNLFKLWAAVLIVGLTIDGMAQGYGPQGGTQGYQGQQNNYQQGGGPGMHRQGQGQGQRMGQGRGGGGMAQMMQKLGITDEQRQKMQAARQSGKAKMQGLRQETKAKRDELKTLMSSGSASDGQVYGLIDQIVQLQRQKMAGRYESIKELRTILTPEQFKAFESMRQQRKGKRGQRGNRRGGQGRGQHGGGNWQGNQGGPQGPPSEEF
jgi:periplasmic protein CpxP/Spy